MLLTNPSYSCLFSYLESIEKIFDSQDVDCQYQSYQKGKGDFIYFVCFNLKSNAKLRDFLFSEEISYNGNLEFEYNKVTNEVYIHKVPFVDYSNVKVPVFTSDIVKIIIEQLEAYLPPKDIKLSFADQLVPLAEDRKAQQLLPSLLETRNHRILVGVLESIKKEKKYILNEIHALKEHRYRIDKKRELAIAKKRRILGIDPNSFLSIDEFLKSLNEKKLTIWNKDLESTDRHLENSINAYRQLLLKGSLKDCYEMLKLILMEKIKENSEDKNSLWHDYSDYKDVLYYIGGDEFFRFSENQFYDKSRIPDDIKEIASLCSDMLSSIYQYGYLCNEKCVGLIEQDKLDRIIDIIMHHDLYSEFGVYASFKKSNAYLEDFKQGYREAHHATVGILSLYCQILELFRYEYNTSYSKFAKVHPLYKQYYDMLQRRKDNFDENVFYLKDKTDCLKPFDLLTQIRSLTTRKDRIMSSIANPMDTTINFYKNSSSWGSIMQIPYWNRVSNDPFYDKDLLVPGAKKYGGHESYYLLMIQPGVEIVDMKKIVSFVDGPRFKGSDLKKGKYHSPSEFNSFNRLMITIPKSLDPSQLGPLLDYAHSMGKKINFVCEDFETSIRLKKIIIKKMVDAYQNGRQYFDDWCFINVDPTYYKSFLVDTPSNKVFWHRYDYSSDYPFRRKEMLSFNRIVELAIEYVTKSINSFDYQLLETIILGDYNSNEYIYNDFRNVIDKETAGFEEQLLLNKQKRLLKKRKRKN